MQSTFKCHSRLQIHALTTQANTLSRALIWKTSLVEVVYEVLRSDLLCCGVGATGTTTFVKHAAGSFARASYVVFIPVTDGTSNCG